jgi:hypothetical protein
MSGEKLKPRTFRDETPKSAGATWQVFDQEELPCVLMGVSGIIHQ